MLIFDQLKKNDAQLRLIALLILGGLFVLLTGLWWVQIVRGGKYQASQEGQSFISVRVPAARGKIFDCNGVALAENRPSYNLNLYVEELPREFQNEYKKIRPRETITNDLPFWKAWLGFEKVKTRDKPIPEAQKEHLKRTARFRVANGIVAQVSDAVKTPLSLEFTNFSRYFDKDRALPYIIASNLSPAQLAGYAEKANVLPAVDLEVQSIRHYPFGATAAHVLGYGNRQNESVTGEQSYYDYRMPDFRGLVGIEGYYDLKLRGAAGQKTLVVNNMRYRQTEHIVIPVEPGKNIHLTLDLKTQQAAEKALQTHIGPGGKGAVVVMDVWSGDVLALVSLPARDPSVWVRGATREEYIRWTDEEIGLQKNRATREIYQAGSIFKTIVALAALETPEARFDPKALYRVRPNDQNSSRGMYYGDNFKKKDTAPPGDYDLELAIMHSSNAYFIDTGLRKGVFERVIEIGRRLHLSERVGLPLMQESAGIFPSKERIKERGWSTGRSADICIGQGEMAVTPMQMAVLTSALANGGKVLKPRLVSRIEAQDIASVEPPEMIEARQVRDTLNVSERSLKILRNAMLSETEKSGGTGYDAFSLYYRNSANPLRVCGKTGTAELDVRGADGRLKNTTWFASFAPYEQPRFAVVVMAENGQSGGRTCAPVARDVYMALEKFGRPTDPTQSASTR